MMLQAVRRLARPQVVRSLVARPVAVRLMTTKFAASHEWIKVEGDVATIGITEFAQAALGDVVYVELPEVGASFSKGDSFGSVESVKAASDLYAPISGEVVDANKNLQEDPSLVNKSPESDGWFAKFKLSDKSELDGLMDAAAYKALTAKK